MADNYTRQGETYRAVEVSGVKSPVVLVGAHSRVYDGIEVLTLTASAQSLTVPGGATHADVYCSGAVTSDYARYWHGGTSPTVGTGVKLKDGELLESASPGSLKAIIGSGSPVLSIEYFHYA